MSRRPCGRLIRQGDISSRDSESRLSVLLVFTEHLVELIEAQDGAPLEEPPWSDPLPAWGSHAVQNPSHIHFVENSSRREVEGGVDRVNRRRGRGSAHLCL